MSKQAEGALTGTRVLDLSRVLAGPFCTMLLADLGAEVIKVEEPRHGDETRGWGPPWVGEGPSRQSAYFQSVNRNKKSLAVDLKTSEGQQIVRSLAAGSQVLVENFKPGGLERYGLDFHRIRKVQPRLVYCSISGFGQDGPYRERPGYDSVIQAMSGLMSITGPAEGSSHKVGVAISDVLTGLYASTCILAALRHADLTGRGQWIDLALLDCQIAALVNVAANYLASGQPPGRHGNQHANIVPYQPFQAADGPFMLAVGNDSQFERLCEVMGHPELSQDPRFQQNAARVANRAELLDVLSAGFSRRSRAQWLRELLDAGVPAGPLRTVPEALEDEHSEFRGLVQSLDEFRTVGPPMRLSETPARIHLPPPHLGQHSRPVLRNLLGMNGKEIERLHRAGVIRLDAGDA